MGINERLLKALKVTRGLGIPDKEVKPVLQDLLQVYEWNWEPVEAEEYRVLLDAYFESKENQGVEDEKEDNMEHDGSKRPSKRLQGAGKEDHVSSAVANSSKTLALEKAKMPLNTSTQGITELSQKCSMDRSKEFSSQPVDKQPNSKRKDPISSHLPSTDRKSSHDGVRVSHAVDSKQPLDAHGSSHTSKQNIPTSHCNRKLIKPKIKLLIGDMSHCSEPLAVVSSGTLILLSDILLSCDNSTCIFVAKYFWLDFELKLGCALCCLSANHSTGNWSSLTMPPNHSKQPLDAHGSSHTSKQNIPTSRCNRKLIKHKTKPLIGDMSHCSEPLSVVSSAVSSVRSSTGNHCVKSEDGVSTGGTVINNSSPEVVVTGGESLSSGRLKKRDSGNGNSERDLKKKGKNCSGILNSSNLVNIQQQTVTKRLFLSISDITKGVENVKISLVDEFGNEDLPKFTYMQQCTIYQGAYIHISLARISDEDCCSSCSGDCLSSSIPCACARETGGEFAYTQQGLLKEKFLDACLSMLTGVHDQGLVYCQDCPLERSKNEKFPEQCKGHIIRKFIKECWRKCGCNMNCGNRVVQRGITCELQVFLTGDGKGWGLRTLQDLPKGTFVCEYVGEILTNTELYERNMESSGSERHTYPVTLDADWGSERILKDEEALCLDATFSGNVARFINHRCFDANLTDIPVEVETPDRHYYHLALFTARNVNALEELTWDYGIDFSDHNHPIKAFKCGCGSAVCRDVKRKS
ncbi:hypothetical protein Ddye_025839 [Dipteronia dyeriana]|uniref:Histone-lysine N-methyltransferase SUVR4 n=1 Tax=Dipteronia dyeriana TaxID=168575 RepID=A0AAD9TLY5_9ROSI|nr:hypothetical protein Ddye_025839 [Dipteronia dyeriana]